MVFHMPVAARIPGVCGVALSETVAVTDSGCETLTAPTRSSEWSRPEPASTCHSTLTPVVSLLDSPASMGRHATRGAADRTSMPGGPRA
jgi:hypothetical protein